jgi:hypothetical protein
LHSIEQSQFDEQGMYRNDAARSVGLKIAEVLDCNAPVASAERPQVEIIEFTVGADMERPVLAVGSTGRRNTLFF